MVNDDWYRRTTWTAEDQVAFEKRLARARNKRHQYLRIQASTLAKTESIEHARPAIELARRYLREYPAGAFRAEMYETKARAYGRLGWVRKSIEAYRKGIAVDRSRPNLRDCVYIQFAWFAATQGLDNLYDEVMAAMNENSRDVDIIPAVNRYRYFGALALIADDLGEVDEARETARHALSAASMGEGPSLGHRELGLFPEEATAILHRLKTLAGGGDWVRRPR